jgi:ABC-type enterochelin transport system substrate-binding protein
MDRVPMRAGLLWALAPKAIGASLALCLLLPGCGTKEQTFNAPDPAKVIQATSKVKASQKAAHDTHQKEREKVKLAQENVDALSLASVGALEKLDALTKIAPVELLPPIAAIRLDVDRMQHIELILSQNLASAWVKSDETEKHLNDTDARIAELEKEHANYYSDAQAIADTATALNARVIELEKKVSWYRWHWWGSWIALGAGVLACGLFAFVKFTGKSLFGLGAVAARVAI